MHTPDQSPQEEQKSLSEPFYEFPEGIPYPPPPSFYQNMSDMPKRIPLSAMPSLTRPLFPGSHPMRTLPEEQRYVTGVQPPVPQAPVKKSRRWLWIVIAILSVTMLVSCSLCSWAGYGLFSTAFEQVSGTLGVINDYYAAIQAKNYMAAYNDLALQGTMRSLTFEQFHEQASSRDAQYGPVSSYTPRQPSYSIDPTRGPDLSHLTFVVEVNRTKLNYTVLLTVSNFDGHWKITDFDRI